MKKFDKEKTSRGPSIECPVCHHIHEASGSHEDDEGTWECYKCDKEFIVEIEYEPYYYTVDKEDKE